MMVNYGINVTERHIADGVKGNCESCPIALAIKDKFNLDEVLVSSVNIVARIHDIGKNYSYTRNIINAETPNEVLAFINGFDSGYQVNLFKFYLPIEELPSYLVKDN